VLKEIERSLESHELIKIRVYNDEREVRDQYLASICEQLGAAPGSAHRQTSGDLAPCSGGEIEADAPRRPRAEPARSKRSFQGSNRK
jgi:RNA-binding protein